MEQPTKIIQGDESEKRSLVETCNSAQEVVDAVQNDHAVGVYRNGSEDTYLPEYLVFYNIDQFQKFEKALTDAKNEPIGSDRREKLIEEIKDLSNSDVDLSSLNWIYKSAWAIKPDELINKELTSEKAMEKQQEEDSSWFDMQREHFKKLKEYGGDVQAMDDSESMEKWMKDPSMDKVMKRAEEIAGGGDVEEGDINTAILQLRDEVPKEIVEMVRRRLREVENAQPDDDGNDYDLMEPQDNE